MELRIAELRLQGKKSNIFCVEGPCAALWTCFYDTLQIRQQSYIFFISIGSEQNTADVVSGICHGWLNFFNLQPKRRNSGAWKSERCNNRHRFIDEKNVKSLNTSHTNQRNCWRVTMRATIAKSRLLLSLRLNSVCLSPVVLIWLRAELLCVFPLHPISLRTFSMAAHLAVCDRRND